MLRTWLKRKNQNLFGQMQVNINQSTPLFTWKLGKMIYLHQRARFSFVTVRSQTAVYFWTTVLRLRGTSMIMFGYPIHWMISLRICLIWWKECKSWDFPSVESSKLTTLASIWTWSISSGWIAGIFTALVALMTSSSSRTSAISS